MNLAQSYSKVLVVRVLLVGLFDTFLEQQLIPVT